MLVGLIDCFVFIVTFHAVLICIGTLWFVHIGDIRSQDEVPSD